MIEIGRHIEILLLTNDCVIVPDFGGFMAHHLDARFDETDHLFLPPLRTVGFNPQLKINDSLLAQSYVETYDISYPEALRQIEAEVNELKQQLESEGSYELNGIGTLSLNEDGKYVFTPCEAGILTPSFYALSSFAATRLQAAAPAPALVLKKEAEEEVETEEEAEVEEEAEDTDVIKIRYTWMRNAIAAAAILLALFLISTPTGNNEFAEKTISNLNSHILFGMMVKDTNCNAIEIKKDAIDKCATADTVAKKVSPEAAPSIKSEKKELPYSIVLACYITKQNAATFVEKLHQEGYKDAKVDIRDNVTRVVYGNYETIDAAQSDLRDLHKDQQLREAWIYKLN